MERIERNILLIILFSSLICLGLLYSPSYNINYYKLVDYRVSGGVDFSKSYSNPVSNKNYNGDVVNIVDDLYLYLDYNNSSISASDIVQIFPVQEVAFQKSNFNKTTQIFSSNSEMLTSVLFIKGSHKSKINNDDANGFLSLGGNVDGEFSERMFSKGGNKHGNGRGNGHNGDDDDRNNDGDCDDNDENDDDNDENKIPVGDGLNIFILFIIGYIFIINKFKNGKVKRI